MMWGKHKENGIWWVKRPLFKKRYKTKVMWRNHNALYVAIGRFRLRFMKRGKEYGF